MRPLRILVVDDEKLAREEICFLLDQIGGCELVGEAADGVSALRAAGELKPDLMFLDIQMPGLTGFEVARRMIEADLRSQLVFVTAFDQYAVEAFSVNAVDYLLKPVDGDRLEQTLERARRRLASLVGIPRIDRSAPSRMWRPNSAMNGAAVEPVPSPTTMPDRMWSKAAFAA